MKFFSINNIDLYFAIVLAIINGVLMCFASYKFFQIIQLSGYKLKGYFAWLKDTKARYISRIMLLSVLSLFCVLVTNALFNVFLSNTSFSFIGLIFYFYFTIVFIKNLYSAPKKVPLKLTSRMTRLNIALGIFSSALSFIIMALSVEYLGFIKFGALCIVPIFMPILVPIVHIVLIPLEKLIIRTYILRAKKKLKNYNNLIKIGITGSFGKTSTKYILNTLLSQKYKVCMSPHSFNTPTGLSKVVNNYLEPTDEVLIAEMGARRVGDIKTLCKLINPKYAIITGIGNQHLLNFKTEENILKTKNELIESLPQDGIAVFNANNQGSLKLYENCNLKKYAVGSSYKDSNVKASNLKYDENGTSFKLTINKNTYNCKTMLLGEHNIENILLCVQFAKILGLSDEQILFGIAELKPIPHRLELIKTDTNIILDDSYNASVDGSTMALKTLKNFGNRRIVITPGLVELGNKEVEENINFGKKIAEVANIVIIVNKQNFEAIKKGLSEKGFNEEDIYQAETLDQAKILMKDFLKKGDAILFENDLPDNYI